ncbi:MAG: undecaprenyl-diphosphate phosphatase, partial [Dehalococcoidia bacterium]
MRRRDALLLGAAQGLTEFLPISSSAHLMIVRRLTGQDDIHRAFDVALHLGTAAALLVSTRRDWSTALRGLRRSGRPGLMPWSRGQRELRLAEALCLSTLPAVAAGALYHDGF